MKILAVESAFEACSVALSQEGDVLERVEPGPRGHAAHLLPMVQAVLAEAGLALNDLDAVAFSRGPGSFTSLRIGIGVVQGLAWGAELPVLPLSSLRCIAQGAAAQGVTHAWVAVDARMDEVYTGCFQLVDGLMQAVSEEHVCAPEAAARLAKVARDGEVVKDGTLPAGMVWAALGNGFERFEALRHVTGSERRPEWSQLTARASQLLPLACSDFANGLALPAEQAQPVYLRDKVALKAGERPT